MPSRQPCLDLGLLIFSLLILPKHSYSAGCLQLVLSTLLQH